LNSNLLEASDRQGQASNKPHEGASLRVALLATISTLNYFAAPSAREAPLTSSPIAE
jgi:hypothetical protein